MRFTARQKVRQVWGLMRAWAAREAFPGAGVQPTLSEASPAKSSSDPEPGYYVHVTLEDGSSDVSRITEAELADGGAFREYDLLVDAVKGSYVGAKPSQRMVSWQATPAEDGCRLFIEMGSR